MQFPTDPPIGHQETNPNTGAIYEWDGSIWVNVPGEGSGVTEDDIARMVADQNRQDQALQQETTERMERDMLERGERISGDQALQDQIDGLQGYDDSALADGLALEIKEREDGETALQDQLDALEPYDDTQVKEDLRQLQEGFDAATIAAQEGAENLTLELQSYSKKDHAHSWGEITGKPSTFAPSSHTHDYLPLSGGELTNTLTGRLIKSTRNTGYAFEAKPDNATTTASIHTDGSAKFKGSVKVDGTALAKVDHTHSGYAASNHDHGATYAPASHTHDYAATNHSHSNYASSSHTHSGYASSSHTHSGYASSSHSHSGYVQGSFTITKSNGNFYIS